MMGYRNILRIGTILLHVGFCVCLNTYITDDGVSHSAIVDLMATQLTSIMERLTSIDQRLNAVDQRFTSLDERVTTLNQRVNTLDNSISNIQSSHGKDSLMATSTETPSPTATPGSEFRITRVTKVEKGDYYKVRIEYEASAKPDTVTIMGTSMRGAIQHENADFGQVEVSIPKHGFQGNEYYGSQTRVIFCYPDRCITAALKLTDTPSNMELPRITGDISLAGSDVPLSPGSDIIYPPGSDVRLDIVQKVEGAREAIDYQDVSIIFSLKSDTEAQRVNSYTFMTWMDQDFPVGLDLLSTYGEDGDFGATVRFNSTLQDPRGLLEFYAETIFNCSENCLLREVTTMTRLSFYSQADSGPFPDGFLGFVVDRDKKEPSKVFCDIARPDECEVYCQAAGSEASTIRISRVLPGGHVIATDYVTLAEGQWSGAVLWFSNVTFADAGVYRCSATSGSKVITMDMSLTVVRAAKIDRNSSQAVHFDNGTGGATCIAAGNPAPNVTFEDTNLADVSPEDYDVTVTQLDEFTTRADIIITNPDEFSNMYYLTCRASNVNSADDYMLVDQHYIRIDEGNLYPYVIW